ncbi:DUF4430 domain-containing protein [Rhodopirellula sp. MGV]|uniref:DUF4430 domain-containing protein n=1 Tax=Rhodopirellula sp. MGV TaxID=2023130 RepID=UPI000B961B3D|nr:DUF4430 domain-containing protein [Rhodopirellula sp. MGV]OYP35179.1 hypothetical protein CGZ80_12325 [Rhodopirellula sp. MGV]PNY37807.1 DUF4430 domain-containing protein [Rhodopirellula baltica]
MRQTNTTAGIVLSALLLIGCGTEKVSTTETSQSGATGTVTIEIIPSDGEPLSDSIENVADGATLETVMSQVDVARVTLRGSDTTAFVESIDGLGTTSGQGWTFKVDGEYANQGIGQTQLHPPTTVTWTYGTFE